MAGYRRLCFQNGKSQWRRDLENRARSEHFKIFDGLVECDPPGSYVVIPAGAVDFVLAKDGAVVYQESGIGPAGNMFLKR